MKFKQLVVSSCFVIMLVLTPTHAADRPSWLIELPRVMCLKNQLWLVWKTSEYAVQVTGIFCSLTEDLV